MKNLLFIVCLIFPVLSWGQDANTFLAKGKKYHDNDQFREALYYLNKHLAGTPDDPLALKLRGNCYFSLNQLDSARYDYERALSQTTDMPELHYNIGNVYELIDSIELAEKHFRKFLKYRSDDVDGILRLGNILQAQSSDSSLYFIKKAYELDSLNQHAVNMLGWEYYYRHDYKNALELANYSHSTFKLADELQPLRAYGNFATGNFGKAIAVVDSLIVRYPEDVSLYVLRIKTRILSKTRKEQFTHEQGKTRFVNISSSITSSLDQLVQEPSSEYYHMSLTRKFNENPNALGLDEFFMAYYGFTANDQYSPYSRSEIKLRELFQDEKYEEIVNETSVGLKSNPFDLSLLEAQSLALMQLKRREEFEVALTKYVGVMQSILATGSGDSYESAYIVISASHEYDIFNYIGFTSRMQALHNSAGHVFDVLTTSDGVKVYFNIDKPYGSLGRMFGNTDKNKSGKKNKASKKRQEK